MICAHALRLPYTCPVAAVDARTEEGRMVTSYYRVEDFPVVLVIEPATGQLMKTIKVSR